MRQDATFAVMTATEKPPYLLLDTEFLREKTYYSKLCLIQISAPGFIEPTIIDPLDPDTNLQPLYDMLFDPEIVKVLHSGYQDLEIIYHLTGKVPAPVFDTQVAASVLGYGEQVSYAALVKDICNITISKSQQFTDWSLRPLLPEQIDYALGDVIYLDQIYHTVKEQLKERERESWIAEDHQTLENPQTYNADPHRVYEKIKMRSDKPQNLGVLREIAAWREEEARRKNLPKGFILRDETLMEIAMTMPKDGKALERVRGFPNTQISKTMGKAMLKAVADIKAADPDTLPRRAGTRTFPSSKAGALEMLRLMLKIAAAQHDITPRRIADNDELQEIAIKGRNADVPALQGWRFEIFGQYVLDLIDGKTGLFLKDGEVVVQPCQPD